MNQAAQNLGGLREAPLDLNPFRDRVSSDLVHPMKIAASLVGLIAIPLPNPDVPPVLHDHGCTFELPPTILFTQAIDCLLGPFRMV